MYLDASDEYGTVREEGEAVVIVDLLVPPLLVSISDLPIGEREPCELHECKSDPDVVFVFVQVSIAHDAFDIASASCADEVMT